MIWIIVTLGILLSLESFIIFKLIKEEFSRVCIPFNSDYNQGVIYIECTCSGRNLCFIVDTGCSNTTIKQESLNELTYKKHKRKFKQYGIVGESFNGILRSITIQIAEHHFEVFCYAIDNNLNLPKGVDGLLGSDFFSKYGWSIDYKQKYIIIN